MSLTNNSSVKVNIEKIDLKVENEQHQENNNNNQEDKLNYEPNSLLEKKNNDTNEFDSENKIQNQDKITVDLDNYEKLDEKPQLEKIEN